MPEKSKKLLQRAELIAILNKYRDAIKIDNLQLYSDIDLISKYEDKAFILKTLLGEISSSKGLYCDICSIIAIEAIETKLFEELSLKFLQDKTIDDDKKFLIVSLMREKGIDFDFGDIADYINNPEELAHNGVENFLKNAIYDPDVQLDLLDFYINIPKDEKIYFLENLKTEFECDDFANAFSILAQLNLEQDEFEYIFDSLLQSDSPYALCGLKHIYDNKKLDSKTKAKLRRKIKKINEKTPNFVNDFLTKDSEVYKTYIGFVDGKSNFSLVFSRKRKDETLDTLMFGVNITKGITSCMGFCSIAEDNFNSIIKRLFSDSPPIKITPIALKTLYEHYISKTESNDIELPYEFIVWKNMLNDVRKINFDISEFINSKLDRIKLSSDKVKKFSAGKMVETWYYSQGDNIFVDEIIEKIENQHLLDLDKINEIVSKTIDENFLNDKKFMAELQSKLLIQAYVASLAKLKLTSACAYSLCFKSNYTKLFIASMIDKSIYYALSTKLYQLEDKNIFKKESPTKFKKEELELLMAQLEEKWS